MPYGSSTVPTDCYVLSQQTGAKLRSFGVCEGGFPAFFADAESRYMIVSSMNSEPYTLKELLLIDTQSGKTEALPLSVKKANEAKAAYLPALGCWAGAVTSEQKTDKYTSVLIRIDPKQAKFSRNAKALYVSEAMSSTELGSNLKNAREKADAIEKKYGIRILIGNEVNALPVSYFRIVSSEARTSSNNIAADTEYALSELDNKLAHYPASFFGSFRKNGKKGLRISLTGELLDADPNRAGPAGIAFVSDDWYNAAMISSELIPISSTLHHEIFHAVEQAMADLGKSFDESRWNALNPAGFVYGNIPDLPNDKLPIMGDNHENTAYFSRPYGMTNAMEDRAAIAEYCFGEWFGEKGYDIVRKYPHVRAKLDYMEQLLTECYGSAYLSNLS
jgi:hypothetical protein